MILIRHQVMLMKPAHRQECTISIRSARTPKIIISTTNTKILPTSCSIRGKILRRIQILSTCNTTIFLIESIRVGQAALVHELPPEDLQPAPRLARGQAPVVVGRHQRLVVQQRLHPHPVERRARLDRHRVEPRDVEAQRVLHQRHAQHLPRARSPIGVLVEQAPEQVGAELGELALAQQRQRLVEENRARHLLDGRSAEGVLQLEDLVENAAEREHVRLLRVEPALEAADRLVAVLRAEAGDAHVEGLGGHVVGRAEGGDGDVVVDVGLAVVLREAEVGDLDDPLLRDEDVLRLEVAVQDVVAVEVLDGEHDLHEESEREFFGHVARTCRCCLLLLLLLFELLLMVMILLLLIKVIICSCCRNRQSFCAILDFFS